jgi:hypothetical protein
MIHELVEERRGYVVMIAYTNFHLSIYWVYNIQPAGNAENDNVILAILVNTCPYIRQSIKITQPMQQSSYKNLPYIWYRNTVFPI